MIKTLLIVLLLAYLLVAQRLFKTWLKFFRRDTTMSSEDRRLSLAVLSLGTILWPLVVPIAYLRLLEEKLEYRDVSQRDRSELKNSSSTECCSERVTVSC
ncbi:MAG TPA: hypothetical protein V6C85_11410 [Allocoleopsis sp.]